MNIIPFTNYLIITDKECYSYSMWSNINCNNLKHCCYYDGISGIILYDDEFLTKENFKDIKPVFDKLKFKESLETLQILETLE